MAEAGEFNLIVSSVESGGLAEAAKSFAKAFSLDDTIAQQICKSAPIIFAHKLTKTEVKAISPVLAGLSKLGIEFRVSARVAGKLPKVNWPVRPQFTAGGAAGVSGLAFEWDNNAFVCPGCGESFLFRRLGKLQLAEAPETNGQEVQPAVRAARPSRVAVGAPSGIVEEPTPAPQIEGVEGLAPVAGQGESLDLPEAEPEEISLRDDLPAAEPELAPVEPLEELAPAEGGGEFSQALEEDAPAPAPEPEPEPPPPAEPEAPVEEAPLEEAPAVEAGELYNVFLSKITDTSKRDKAAELIAKVKGCSGGEAKELTTRLVIPLAKNVPKAKAEDILNQFKKLKIFGRMTKVK
jgi:hypothetical protein